MPIAPDINDTGMPITRTTLKGRHGELPQGILLTGSEIEPGSADRGRIWRPLLSRQRKGCNLAVMKTGDHSHRCQFFYRNGQLYGTGLTEYGDLTECVASLLQAQTDHPAKERSGI